MYTVQRMFASVLRYERHSKIGSCHDYDAVNRGDASLATTSLPSAVTTVLSTACRASSFNSRLSDATPAPLTCPDYQHSCRCNLLTCSPIRIAWIALDDSECCRDERRALVSVCGRRSTDRQISTTCACVCVCGRGAAFAANAPGPLYN